MIEINEVEITQTDDYDQLKGFISNEYLHEKAINELKSRIGTNCDKVIIEFPYYDGDYLSTYYSFYSMKHREYSKKCYRLHFTNKGEYQGYITLRPTVYYTKVGKSYLSPKLLIKNKAFVTLSDFEINLAGSELSIGAFPWMYQETDISVCAHVAVWSVIRYYGNKYKNYADVRMSDIIEMTPEYIDRKIPSRGLNILQIPEILKQFGFSPLLIQKNSNNPDEFYDEVMSYIESGIPLIGVMTQREHAISILGHGQINSSNLNSKGTILSSRLIESVVVNDDNYLPYIEVYRQASQPTACVVTYAIEDIDFVIAPLYNRMQLGYRAVLRRVTDLFNYGNYGFPNDKVVRIYMTSSRSLKKNILKSNNMNDSLKNIVLRMNMPKFVWCVDIATPTEYCNGLTSSRILIDTTCCTYEESPYLLIHDSKKIVFNDGGVWKSINIDINAYNIYTNNLVEV